MTNESRVGILTLTHNHKKSSFNSNYFLNHKTRKLGHTITQSLLNMDLPNQVQRYEKMSSYVTKLDKLIGIPEKLTISPTLSVLKDACDDIKFKTH